MGNQEDLNDTLARVTERLLDNYDRYQNLESEYKDLLTQYEKADKENDKLHSDYNELNAMVKRIQKANRDLLDKCSQLEAENKELRVRLKRARAGSDDTYHELYDKLRVEHNELRNEYRHVLDVVESALDSVYTDPIRSARSYVQEKREDHRWPSYIETMEDDEALDL